MVRAEGQWKIVGREDFYGLWGRNRAGECLGEGFLRLTDALELAKQPAGYCFR